MLLLGLTRGTPLPWNSSMRAWIRLYRNLSRGTQPGEPDWESIAQGEDTVQRWWLFGLCGGSKPQDSQWRFTLNTSTPVSCLIVEDKTIVDPADVIMDLASVTNMLIKGFT